MSCVLKNGNVLEVAIKGLVNGEDGSFGMRGKVISKQGQMLMQAAFAGLFGGLGSGIAQQNATIQSSALGTVTTIDPNKVMQSGLATGASTSLNKISDFYLAQANAIFPVIEIAGTRAGEVYLMEGADFGQSMLEAEQLSSNDGGKW
jgi:conjugal transfer pilus assembly protein TraB